MVRLSDIAIRLPRISKSAAIACLAAGLVLAGIVFSGWRSYVSRTPEYAFRIVNEITAPADIISRQAYLTEQGAKVVTYGLTQSKGPTTGPKMIFDHHQIRGTSCYFPFTQGTDAGYLEFKLEKVWQFHDIVLTRHKGRDVDLSVAYYIDHPFLASLQVVDWSELAGNFLTGFMIGFSGGR